MFQILSIRLYKQMLQGGLYEARLGLNEEYESLRVRLSVPSRITRDHPVDTMVQGWKISCQPRTRRDGIELQRQRFSAQKRSYCFLGQPKQFVFSYFYCPRTPSATFSQLTTATMGDSPATLLPQLALRAQLDRSCDLRRRLRLLRRRGGNSRRSARTPAGKPLLDRGAVSARVFRCAEKKRSFFSSQRGRPGGRGPTFSVVPSYEHTIEKQF